MEVATASGGAQVEHVALAPFELPEVASGTVLDPHPRLAALRARAAVHVGPIDLGAGAAPPDPSRPPPVTVLGFPEVQAVLHDESAYSSAVYDAVVGMVVGRTILEMDEPDHRVHRALVAPAVRPRLLCAWEEGLVREVAHEVIDSFAAEGRADLVGRFTFAFPVRVVARILGLPRAADREFARLAAQIGDVAGNPGRALDASVALGAHFAEVLTARRDRPRDDLVSGLAVAEVDGRMLSDAEILAFLRLLLPASVETTCRAIGNLLFALFSHPDQLAAVQKERSLLPQAFEEALRWEPPVTLVLRRATRPTRLAGVRIAAGTDIALLLGAANRDERVFDDPDAFDALRPPRGHVGFGGGVHMCLGLHLARMQARVALTALFDRLPRLRWDPAELATRGPCIEGLAFRAPTALPVVFDPS